MTPELDPTRPLAGYRTEGVDYVAAFTGDPFNAMVQAKSQPARARFFRARVAGLAWWRR